MDCLVGWSIIDTMEIQGRERHVTITPILFKVHSTILMFCATVYCYSYIYKTFFTYKCVFSYKKRVKKKKKKKKKENTIYDRNLF